MTEVPLRPGVDLYLIRHGETDWNREGRFQGRTDVPLNPAGVEQARRAGSRLVHGMAPERVAALEVVSSPLLRARRSAVEICRRLGKNDEEIQIREELTELSFGEWEGLTTEEIKSGYRDHRRARRRDRWNIAAPGGESFGQRAPVLRRYLSGIERSSVLVCHAGVIKVCLCLMGVGDRETVLTTPISHHQIYLWSDGTLAAR